MCNKLIIWKQFNFLWIVYAVFIFNQSCAYGQTQVQIILPQRESPRIGYGVKQLQDAIGQVGLKSVVSHDKTVAKSVTTIAIGVTGKDEMVAEGVTPKDTSESFTICSPKIGLYVIAGRDDSGVMYGCIELAEHVMRTKSLPELPKPIQQNPAMRLRGTCIGMMKSTGSRDGGFYDFLWTPENFPWFYDKEHWTEYLDLLAKSRYNTLYFWAGHPFTSILKLPKYPEAQELSDEQLQRNIEMFKWITEQSDRRGIWSVIQFYNIRISHSLAKAHGIGIGVHQPTPLVNAYMRHCISELIKNYSRVGLMVCLGEYLDSEHDAEWLTDTIIPGVKDALKEGEELPPIIVRAHDCPIEEVLDKATPIYPNIYTTSKYTSENLISHQVGGGPG